MNKLRVLSAFGTRPEAVKMAPLLYTLEACPDIESICCLTAQHREMLDSVMDVFGLRADFDLDIMEHGQTLHTVFTKALNGLAEIYRKSRPDLVLVHGDTSTTFAASLAAFYEKVRIGHVEAGLRTFNKYSPFPEEINRKLTGALADLHFCPTRRNAANLAAEGITQGVFVTGNTVIDAMKYTVKPDFKSSSEAVEALDFENRKIISMTCHRRENYGAPMESIFRAVRRLGETRDDIQIIYPVHPSPTVMETAHRILDGAPSVILTEHLDAIEMHNLMARSYLVLTDSGGLQEEAPSLGKPVLVMRRETERQEAIDAGTVRLVGVEEDDIYTAVVELLDNREEYEKMARAVNPYGDGEACKRIRDAILFSFGLSDREPEEFSPGTEA
ncbi:MAG: UDP-N-acetylglucosamine 2-epimerase (non-hydrolyzing) [Clostridiales bacterium]|jgi:UDP-N-acetylglucosamine 2-epimerase (non-hydrolysing)|nr:UDP-N-acetylglucosamine 2-epimerase (non-hydrolyzing) [Clostridiales bacterium]